MPQGIKNHLANHASLLYGIIPIAPFDALEEFQYVFIEDIIITYIGFF